MALSCIFGILTVGFEDCTGDEDEAVDDARPESSILAAFIEVIMFVVGSLTLSYRLNFRSGMIFDSTYYKATMYYVCR